MSQTYEKEVRSVEEIREAIIQSLDATIDALKKIDENKGATVTFDYRGATVSMNIQMTHS